MFICHILHVLYCYSTSFFLKCCSIWCTHSSQDRDQRSGVKRSDLEKEICRISWRCFLNEKKATRKMRVGWTSIRSQLLLITPYCYFLLLIHNCNHFINEISPSVFCMFFFLFEYLEHCGGKSMDNPIDVPAEPRLFFKTTPGLHHVTRDKIFLRAGNDSSP